MNQRRTQGTVFSQVYSLYQTCRKSGTWAKLVLECGENGEEVFSFSSKRSSGQTNSTLTSNIPLNPSNVSSKRKTPSKQKKDRVKWRAWVERKLEDSKDPRREENPSQSGACEALPPSSNSSCVPADSVMDVQCEDRSTIHLQGYQGNRAFPQHSPVPPPSTPTGDEDKDQEKPPVDTVFIGPEECYLAGSGEEGGVSVPAPPTRILRSQSRSRSVTPSRAKAPPNPATPTHRGRTPATPPSNVPQKGYGFQAITRHEFLALSQKKKKQSTNQEK